MKSLEYFNLLKVYLKYNLISLVSTKVPALTPPTENVIDETTKTCSILGKKFVWVNTIVYFS